RRSVVGRSPPARSRRAAWRGGARLPLAGTLRTVRRAVTQPPGSARRSAAIRPRQLDPRTTGCPVVCGSGYRCPAGRRPRRHRWVAACPTSRNLCRDRARRAPRTSWFPARVAAYAWIDAVAAPLRQLGSGVERGRADPHVPGTVCARRDRRCERGRLLCRALRGGLTIVDPTSLSRRRALSGG